MNTTPKSVNQSMKYKQYTNLLNKNSKGEILIFQWRIYEAPWGHPRETVLTCHITIFLSKRKKKNSSSTLSNDLTKHWLGCIYWRIICISCSGFTCWWIVMATGTHKACSIIKFPVSEVPRPCSDAAHFNVSWKHCHHTRHWRSKIWRRLSAQKRNANSSFHFVLIKFR